MLCRGASASEAGYGGVTRTALRNPRTQRLDRALSKLAAAGLFVCRVRDNLGHKHPSSFLRGRRLPSAARRTRQPSAECHLAAAPAP